MIYIVYVRMRRGHIYKKPWIETRNVKIHVMNRQKSSVNSF